MISSVHFGLHACYIVIHILVAPFATTPEDDIAMTMGCSPAFAASVAAQLDTMSSALPMQGPHPGGARTSQEVSENPLNPKPPVPKPGKVKNQSGSENNPTEEPPPKKARPARPEAGLFDPFTPKYACCQLIALCPRRVLIWS